MKPREREEYLPAPPDTPQLLTTSCKASSNPGHQRKPLATFFTRIVQQGEDFRLQSIGHDDLGTHSKQHSSTTWLYSGNCNRVWPTELHFSSCLQSLGEIGPRLAQQNLPHRLSVHCQEEVLKNFKQCHCLCLQS